MASNAATILAVQGLWYGRLCTVSSTTIIIYDHIITFSDELRLIWRENWTRGKILFLLSRYYNIFQIIFNLSILFSSTLSARLCFAWLRWQAVSGIFVYGITEIVLMLRLYAMYNKSRLIVWLMVPAFATEIAAEVAILVLSTRAQIGAVNANPHRTLLLEECILTDTWRFSYLYWIPFLSFETFLFALALIKGYKSYCEQDLRVITLESSRTGNLNLLEILIRDSVLYYMLIFAVYLANTLAWVIDHGRIGEIPVALAVAMSTVMAQRLLLNIRYKAEKRAVGCIDDCSFPMSSMSFEGLGEGKNVETVMSGTTIVESLSMNAEAGPSSPVSPS